ncbi:amino acid transporter [Halovivax ruber XH-70]|uniref:Amino acid transporter n=1 Tax=Halovivax ruber (strain DSM 18193 / JCM 13892 / XH-70) TaxID=797302 RepID=L0IC71_HALRX|nr:APC family permease [Halovivax ruber]AGB15801.1 amino acid transporter [Halovivax ruber XH-70]
MADGPDDSAPSTNVAGEQPVREDADTKAEVTVHDEGTQLERTIGLTGGLAIGIGTMIGAGIFVFPGLAVAEAGPAAALSFGIGAAIAMLVALPTSELATAMPRSGGGYFFISRCLDTGFGAIVGLGLWLGLVFASAFYLVGLGEYVAAVLAELGLGLGVDPGVIGLLFGIGLTAISVTGTENTAKIQNAVVIVLLVILTGFLTLGSLDAVGVVGQQSPPETFFARGYAPVLSTAALVFTSYLGFAQVATVAGEIKEPSRNLSRAMVGSVLLVGLFYVLTIFVATSVVTTETLEAAGETAVVEVARELAGLPGAVLILVGGLLATFSSANASILSSSRTVFALSRDALLPRRAGTINLKYGTPHVALALAGGPILVLTATGQVRLLAEVASFLHLVMYGLMCVALVALRRRSPAWYDPSFVTPGYPVVPIAGAVASFVLIGFMQPESIAVGTAIMIVAYSWYRYYAADIDLRGAF